MILTPQTLKKLHAVPLEVRRWNGNYNRVQINLTVNRRIYDISVSHADPSLRKFGVIDSVYEEPIEVFYNRRKVKEIPLELLPLIDKMKEACKMTPEQTAEIRAGMIQCLREFYNDFYGK